LSAPRTVEFHQVCIGLGSNIDPEENLLRSVGHLSRSVNILARSSVWETIAVGSPGPNFLNAVVLASTHLIAPDLITQVLRPIEAKLGRVRTTDRNYPRTIDLDILIYDREVLDPEIWERAHKCVPLAEVLHDYAHPITGETLSSIASRLAQCTSIRLRHDLVL
jgi:2-amino-4-hydroxy-6-hydroxymethyldihydropteridine diphosphokinase